MANQRPTILFIVHSWGGGTIRFARELAGSISDRVDVVWAWGVDNKSFHISKRGPYFAEQSFDLAAGLNAPLQALRSFRPRRVDVIHTIGLQDHVAALIAQLGVPYDVTFTDYHHFSAAPHFEDASGRFIGDAAVAAVMKDARNNPPQLLRKAERRIATSRDLGRRIERLMPGIPVIPVRVLEPNNAINAPINIVPLAEGEVMRVLVMGHPHPVKRLATVVEVARRAERENAPMEIISLGESSPEVADSLGRLSRVRVLGAYAEEDVPSIVAGLKPHLAWFPFNVAGTHSYVLSDAMRLGLPVLATGIGAVSERVIGRPSTWLVPFDEADAESHFQWLVRLYRERLQTPAVYLPVDHLPPVVEGFYPEAYLEPLLQSRW